MFSSNLPKVMPFINIMSKFKNPSEHLESSLKEIRSNSKNALTCLQGTNMLTPGNCGAVERLFQNYAGLSEKDKIEKLRSLANIINVATIVTNIENKQHNMPTAIELIKAIVSNDINHENAQHIINICIHETKSSLFRINLRTKSAENLYSNIVSLINLKENNLKSKSSLSAGIISHKVIKRYCEQPNFSKINSKDHKLVAELIKSIKSIENIGKLAKDVGINTPKELIQLCNQLVINTPEELGVFAIAINMDDPKQLFDLFKHLNSSQGSSISNLTKFITAASINDPEKLAEFAVAASINDPEKLAEFAVAANINDPEKLAEFARNVYMNTPAELAQFAMAANMNTPDLLIEFALAACIGTPTELAQFVFGTGININNHELLAQFALGAIGNDPELLAQFALGADINDNYSLAQFALITVEKNPSALAQFALAANINTPDDLAEFAIDVTINTPDDLAEFAMTANMNTPAKLADFALAANIYTLAELAQLINAAEINDPELLAQFAGAVGINTPARLARFAGAVGINTPAELAQFAITANINGTGPRAQFALAANINAPAELVQFALESGINTPARLARFANHAGLNANDQKLYQFFNQEIINLFTPLQQEAFLDNLPINQDRLIELNQALTLLNNVVHAPNYLGTEAQELIDNFNIRLNQGQWLDHYIKNNGENIDITNFPESFNRDYKITFTKDFFERNDVIENAGVLNININDLKQIYVDNNGEFNLSEFPLEHEFIKDFVMLFNKDGYTFEEIKVPNPQFERRELNEENIAMYNGLIARIDEQIALFDLESVQLGGGIQGNINAERAYSSYRNVLGLTSTAAGVMYDGMLQIHDRLYDRMEMVRLLTSIKVNAEDDAVNSIAKIISGLPDSLGAQRTAFKDTFTHLFITKNFPSDGIKLTYLHFILRCGQIH